MATEIQWPKHDPIYDPAMVAEGYRMMANTSLHLAAYYRMWGDHTQAAAYERIAKFDMHRAAALDALPAEAASLPNP